MAVNGISEIIAIARIILQEFKIRAIMTLVRAIFPGSLWNFQIEDRDKKSEEEEPVTTEATEAIQYYD